MHGLRRGQVPGLGFPDWESKFKLVTAGAPGAGTAEAEGAPPTGAGAGGLAEGRRMGRTGAGALRSLARLPERLWDCLRLFCAASVLRLVLRARAHTHTLVLRCIRLDGGWLFCIRFEARRCVGASQGLRNRSPKSLSLWGRVWASAAIRVSQPQKYNDGTHILRLTPIHTRVAGTRNLESEKPESSGLCSDPSLAETRRIGVSQGRKRAGVAP